MRIFERWTDQWEGGFAQRLPLILLRIQPEPAP
jgi:hypothetical protein